MSANFRLASDIVALWQENIFSGTPPIEYQLGEGAGLGELTIGPGRVTLLGGAPGVGKTALIMQGVIDAMRLRDTLRVLVCNVEMNAGVLLERQLARLSGIDLTTIRRRQFAPMHQDRLELALATIASFAERLCFVASPYDLENVAASADEFHADVIVLDYIQRIPPPGAHGDQRGAVNATMGHLRRFAEAGVAVFCAAAVGRTRDSRGRTSYDGDGLGLASFRESSELEFGADDAFLLVPQGRNGVDVQLRHLKARYSEPRDIELVFDRARQAFRAVSAAEPGGHGTPSVPLDDLERFWADDDYSHQDQGAPE